MSGRPEDRVRIRLGPMPTVDQVVEAAGKALLSRMAPVCTFCDEPILPEDLPRILGMIGLVAYATHPMHRECTIRSALGSLGHQRGTCPCFGGDEDDPPGMTRRQAARAAEKYFMLYRGFGSPQPRLRRKLFA